MSANHPRATSAARERINRELRTAIAGFRAGRKSSRRSGGGLGVCQRTSDPALASQPLFIVDVGGSTEFILSDGSAAVFRQSFQMEPCGCWSGFGLRPASHGGLAQCDAGVRKTLRR